MRTRVVGACLVLLLALTAGPRTALASDDPIADLAARVLVAVESEDAAALAALASVRTLDPWMVAERLLLQGHGGAAKAYASASEHAAFAGLAAYVEAHADEDAHPKATEVLRLQHEAATLEDAGDGGDALARLDAAATALGQPDRALGLVLRLERGRLLALGGRRDAARPVLQGARTRAAELGWILGEARAWNGLGICAQDPPDRKALVAAYTREADLRERAGDDVNASKAHANLAVTHGMFGDYASAVPHLERATALLAPFADDSANAFNLAHLLWTQGGVYVRMGESARAAATLQHCLRLMETHGKPDEIAEVLANLGEAYRNLTDYEQALRCQERLLALQEERSNAAGVAAAKRMRGLIEYWRGEHEAASKALQDARARYVALEDERHVVYTDLDLGALAVADGRHVEGVERLQAVLEALSRRDDPLPEAYARARLGDGLHALGRHEEAIAMHARGAELARAWGQTTSLLMNVTGVARAELARDHHAESVAAAREAVELMPSLLRGSTAAQAPSVRARLHEVYDIGLRASWALKDAEAVCHFLESGRAGALLEAMTGREAFRDAAVPPALRRRHLAARRTRADTEKALQDARRRRTPFRELKQRRSAMEAAEVALRAVEREIALEARLGAALAYPRAASLATIRAALADEEALVLLRALPDETLALVVFGDEREPRLASLGATARLEDACRALLDAAQDPDSPWRLPLARASRLVEVGLDLPADVTSVLLSPDGILAQVPPALLFCRRRAVFVPSGTALPHLVSSMEAPEVSALAVGDPAYGRGQPLPALPATGDEVLGIPGAVHRLLGPDATVSAVRAALQSQPRRPFLHFACHGLVEDDPWASSLALTPEPGHAGRLTALDVVALPLDTDLVVLSACNSGRGRMVAGEGLIGLTHGFLCAGARRVVVGLWKVDDAATGALMASFHEHWRRGAMPAAEALDRAQAGLRADPRWAHPYYWGAWVQWGPAR